MEASTIPAAVYVINTTWRPWGHPPYLQQYRSPTPINTAGRPWGHPSNLQRMPADAKVSQVDKTRLENRKQEAGLGKDKAGSRFENL